MKEQSVMVPLNLPNAELKLKKKANQIYVWDIFRKSDLLLTREEWVRQHLLHYLVNHLQYPVHFIASEFKIEVNKLTRRCDGVVFDKQGTPKMIIECKEPRVKIDENVLHQVAQYNYALNVDYIILTNGLITVTVYLNRNENTLEYLEMIPDYHQICN